MINDHRLPADVFEKIPTITQGLENLKVAQALYFFGSLAPGELKPLSDLDFALLQGAYAKVDSFEEELQILVPLQIMEVQNGDYVEEDDIERFEDDYERVKKR